MPAEAIDPDPGWPIGTAPFDYPVREHKLVHFRDLNRLLSMADSLDTYMMADESGHYVADHELNVNAIVQELRRIGGF